MTRAAAVGLLLLLLATGCAEPEWVATAESDGAAVFVRSSRPLDKVQIDDGSTPVVVRRFPARPTEARIPAPLAGGRTYTVRLTSGREALSRAVVAPIAGPLSLGVEAPLGQDLRSVADGDVLEFGTVVGVPSRVALRLTSREPWSGEVSLCGQTEEVDLSVPGRQVDVVRQAPPSSDCPGEVGDARFVLRPIPVSVDAARESLQIERVVFPADWRGEPDPGRSPDRVTLPSPGWQRLLRSTPLGVRGRAAETPWANLSVVVTNRGDRPVNTVVRLRITDPDGRPARPFEPRLRLNEGETGQVTALLRVPPGATESARLPVFVDDALLPPGGSAWQRTVEVTPLGSDEALLTATAPLYVKRGSTARAAGFVGVLVSTFGGLLLLSLRLGPWLRRTGTADLVTIALFANLIFVFSAASHLLGLGLASVLGPFSALITGLLNDVFKYALLGTLVTLLPRPGVVALAVLVHYVMSGLALAGFHPTDPLMVGSSVLWLEGGLWLCGITRSGDWRDEGRVKRWLRLSAAFATASVAVGAIAIVAAAVLYRLYFAGWYVALMLAGPGFLYTTIACWLSTGFAESLRRVET